MATTWTVEELAELRQYPQETEVLQRFLDIAIGDVERTNPRLYASTDANDVLRIDRAVEQLVQIDAEPGEYSGNFDGGVLVNSRNDARNRILSQLKGAGVVVQTTRDRVVVEPRIRW